MPGKYRRHGDSPLRCSRLIGRETIDNLPLRFVFFLFFSFFSFFFIFLPYVALRQVLICFYDSTGKHLVSSSWLIDSLSFSLSKMVLEKNLYTKFYRDINIFNVSALIYSMKRFWRVDSRDRTTNVKINIQKWSVG